MKIDIPIPDGAKFIIDKLNSEGYEANLVGGCLRDSLISNSPKDWDINTNAMAECIQDIFNYELVIPTGIKFGTVTIMVLFHPLCW